MPAVHLLLLEQEYRFLEYHMRDFLNLACITHYPNEQSKACLSMEGPQGGFVAYVEWVLVQCGSPFTVCLADEDNTSPTLNPEPSLPSAMPAADQKPTETTADLETEPTKKQSQSQSQCLRLLSS